MSPPQQHEKAFLESIPVDEQINLKELAAKGNYVVYPTKKYPEITEFEHKDAGLQADPKKFSLYDNATKIFNLTPNIGTEIHGIQLSQLTDQQKNDLSLLVAERGVVFFRDQDINPYQGRELGNYFGPLHIHNVVGHPPNLPEIVPIFFSNDNSTQYTKDYFPRNSDGWHSDATYELQPPGLTFLKIDTLPGYEAGDTLWASGYSAYDRLSPELKERLEGLEVVHSGKEQAAGAAALGQTVRREDTEHTHPIIRTHPVTGWKSLFVQPGFARRIVGLNRHESDALLKLLYDHITGGYDFHVRFKWTEDAVAVWDNRNTNHTGVFDYFEGNKIRHGWRITSLAEKPYYDPKSKSRREVLLEASKSKQA